MPRTCENAVGRLGRCADRKLVLVYHPDKQAAAGVEVTDEQAEDENFKGTRATACNAPPASPAALLQIGRAHV